MYSDFTVSTPPLPRSRAWLARSGTLRVKLCLTMAGANVALGLERHPVEHRSAPGHDLGLTAVGARA